MLIHTQNAMTIRCPQCGKTERHIFSCFRLKKGELMHFSCECGAHLISVSNKDPGLCHIQIECIVCGKPHFLTYERKELWNNNLKSFVCQDTGIEMGFLGPAEYPHQGVSAAASGVQCILEDYNYPGFYCDTTVMGGVLARLETLDFQGLLKCACGNKRLNLQVYPDKVEIQCAHCNAVGIVHAESLDDLKWVKSLKEVCLTPSRRRRLKTVGSNKRKHANRQV